ncbi:hypothetical protein Fot_43314 [Forsythia ovata]|uniref:Uncharacterized protein n=1 Tax=Forsythia ovata TaxID=205694 RepID=A0ABD1RNN7_9LAMI
MKEKNKTKQNLSVKGISPKIQESEQPRTSLAEAGKGKRTKAVVDKVEMVMFLLFKTLIKVKESYILQMHKYFIHSHGKPNKTFRSVKELGNFILLCSSVEVSSHRRKAKMTEEEKKEVFLAEANQNRQNMDEMVVHLGDEDNAANIHLLEIL